MPKALSPRPAGRRGPAKPARPALARGLVEEIRDSARAGDREEAVSRFERAVEHLERGDPKGSLREADRAKALAPRSAAVRELRGIALYRLQRWREAQSELKTYKRMTGRVDENHLIADCLRALGRPEQAVPLAEEVLRARVSDEVKTEAVIVAAAALADLGRYAEALAVARRARTRDDVATHPTLRLWYVTADILARAGRPAEAEREFRKILRHDAGAFDVAERLAQLG